MEVKEIKSYLWEIGKAYPSVLGLLKKRLEDSTVGNQWATRLSQSTPKLDADHFANVCFEIAGFERELPDGDRLPFVIREEVLRRMEADQKRLESHVRVLRRKFFQEGLKDAYDYTPQQVIDLWREQMSDVKAQSQSDANDRQRSLLDQLENPKRKAM